jgi:hypothetical protein
VLLDHREGRTDLAGRAVAALVAVEVEEGLLHGMQPLTVRHPFDGGDLASLGGDGELQTGDGPASVEQHRAGAALALIAAFLGTGEIETLTQRVEQGGATVDGQRVLLAVDVQGDGAGRRGRGAGRRGGHDQPSFACLRGKGSRERAGKREHRWSTLAGSGGMVNLSGHLSVNHEPIGQLSA